MGAEGVDGVGRVFLEAVSLAVVGLGVGEARGQLWIDLGRAGPDYAVDLSVLIRVQGQSLRNVAGPHDGPHGFLVVLILHCGGVCLPIRVGGRLGCPRSVKVGFDLVGVVGRNGLGPPVDDAIGL